MTLRTEAAHVSVSVAAVLPCLLQNDDTGATGYAEVYSKLAHTNAEVKVRYPPSHTIIQCNLTYISPTRAAADIEDTEIMFFVSIIFIGD